MVPSSVVPETFVGLVEHNRDILPAYVIVNGQVFWSRLSIRTVSGVLGATAAGALDGDIKDVSFLSFACTDSVRFSIDKDKLFIAE